MLEITKLTYSGLMYFLLAACHMVNAFFIYRLFVRYIQPRRHLFFKICLFFCFTVSNGMIIWLGDHNLILTAPFFIAAGTFCTSGNWYGRQAVSFTFFCMIMSVNAILDTYVKKLDSGLLRGLILPNMGRTVIFAAIFLFLRRKLPENTVTLPNRLWKVVFWLSITPFCMLLATVTLTFRKMFDDIADIQAQYVGAVILPCIFLTSFAILGAVSALEDHEQLEQRSRLAEMRETYYQNLKQQDDSLRHMRHDMNNHLSTVRAMFAGQNQEGAASYLDELLEGVAPLRREADGISGGNILTECTRMSGKESFLPGITRFCANEAANVILQVKANMILQYGLKYDFRIQLPETLSISDIDLCSLIGNALDNAACGASEADDRVVILRCRCDKGIFMLKVQNSFAGRLDKELKTTKPDDGRHGFGISGMREIAARYGGSLDIQVEEQTFTLLVYLYLNSADT